MENLKNILLIDDDKDDMELFVEILRQFNFRHQLHWCSRPLDALPYLRSLQHPTFVFCDINMPTVNGFELKEMINSEKQLLQKCLPFIFLSTSVNHSYQFRAYELGAHGYLVKGKDYTEFVTDFKKVFDYWRICLHTQ